MDETEARVSHMCMKIGINLLGIMYENGFRKIGPVNQQHYDKLGKKKQYKEQLQLPIIYDFEQSIKLYDCAKGINTTIRGESGIVLRPHWRAGYRRRQHYGTNNSQVKVVTIKPVLVNRHLFSGQLSDTKVVIK